MLIPPTSTVSRGNSNEDTVDNVEASKRQARLRWMIIVGSWTAYFVLMTLQTYFACPGGGRFRS
jgi:hypothetical protein